MKRLNLKKFLSLLLTLAMCLSLATSAFAVEEETDPTDTPETTEPTEDIDKEMNTPSVYDEVIQAAGDAVGAAEEAVEKAQEAADEAANAQIDAATDAAVEIIDGQTEVVDRANDVIDSAAAAAETQAGIAADAKETVESSTTSVTEKEAAVLIAQDAAERAAEAAQEAQRAWETANEAVEAAQKAVEDAEAEYQRILDAHDHEEALNSEEFEAKLVSAQEKLKAAQDDLDSKKEAHGEAAITAKNAKDAAEKAESAYTEAKDKSGFEETRIEGVAENQAKLNEGDKTLKDQTEDVKGSREALDNLGTTDEAQKALDEANQEKGEAQAAVDNFDKTGLENEEQSRKDYKDASEKLEELKGQTGELDSKRQELWDAYKPVDSQYQELNGQITMWKQGDTPIAGDGLTFTNPAFASWNNATLKEAVDTWNATGQLSSYAQYAFGQSNYDTRDKADFMAVVSACLNSANMPDFEKCDQLKTQKEDLYSKWDEARRALEQNGKDISAKEKEVEDLDALLERFDELNGLKEALETAESNVSEAQGKLDALQGEIDKAKQAYDDAVKELVKTLGAKGTDYSVSTKDGHDKLVTDAENLEKAIEALNDRKVKNQAKKDADEAAKKAEKAYQDASDAMDAAQEALTKATTALDDAKASSTCTVKDLVTLRADLAAKQARFNEVKAEFDAKQTARDQAVEDARQAAQDAQDAQDALDRIIASLPVGDPDDADTADDDDDDDDAEAAPEELLIEDELVPLAAGPIATQNVLDVLYKFEGSPNGADPEGEFTLAIAWGVASDIIDEETDATELVTGAILKDILTRYDAAYDRAVVEVAALTTLTAADDEIVDNCGEVLAEFLGQEYAAPETDAAA